MRDGSRIVNSRVVLLNERSTLHVRARELLLRPWEIGELETLVSGNLAYWMGRQKMLGWVVIVMSQYLGSWRALYLHYSSLMWLTGLSSAWHRGYHRLMLLAVPSRAYSSISAERSHIFMANSRILMLSGWLRRENIRIQIRWVPICVAVINWSRVINAALIMLTRASLIYRGLWQLLSISQARLSWEGNLFDDRLLIKMQLSWKILLNDAW